MITPDRWVVFDSPIGYRVFGTWGGGFVDGDSWRLNSGIVKVDVYEDHIEFHGASGSIYSCRKSGYGAGMYGQGLINNIVASGAATLLPEDTDWANLLEEKDDGEQ